MRWLTPRQFMAENPGLGRNTLYERMRDGTIPHVRIGPRKILLPADAIEQIFARQMPESRLRERTEKPLC